MKLSDSTSPVIGNKELILLCDKVSKGEQSKMIKKMLRSLDRRITFADDVEVRFFEEAPDGSLVWESYGDFQPSDVHKQYAICFRTPQYRDLEISAPVRVFVELRCPSKDTTSARRPFDYIPLQTDVELLKRKRQKLAENNHQRITQYFEETGGLLKRSRVASFPPMPSVSHGLSSPHQTIPQTATIKLERQASPDYYAYSAIGFSGGGLQAGSDSSHMGGSSNNPSMVQIQQQLSAVQAQQQQARNHHSPNPTQNFFQHTTMTMEVTQQQQLAQMEPATASVSAGDDFGNISLPNLSDVNLSLLENNLSENLSTNLVLIDPDVQALGMQGTK